MVISIPLISLFAQFVDPIFLFKDSGLFVLH